jgi:GxxExxY protein
MNKIIEFSKLVGKQLGKGFSECVYHEALCVHLRKNSIDYSKEQIMPITYNINNEEYVVGNVRSDIVLPNESIVIECKAIEGNLRGVHVPQIITYLNILNYKNGIIVNFNQNPLKEMVEHITVEKNNDEYIVNGEEKYSKNGVKI